MTAVIAMRVEMKNFGASIIWSGNPSGKTFID